MKKKNVLIAKHKNVSWVFYLGHGKKFLWSKNVKISFIYSRKMLYVEKLEEELVFFSLHWGMKYIKYIGITGKNRKEKHPIASRVNNELQGQG